MYKCMKYVGCVTVSIKSNLWRDRGIPEEIPASRNSAVDRHHGKLTMARNRHPAAIFYPSMCKECVAFVRSDYRNPFQLIYTSDVVQIWRLSVAYRRKFALRVGVGYRKTRPPFWDALISRYRRPMTNGVAKLSSVTLIRLCHRLVVSRSERLNQKAIIFL